MLIHNVRIPLIPLLIFALPWFEVNFEVWGRIFEELGLGVRVLVLGSKVWGLDVYDLGMLDVEFSGFGVWLKAFGVWVLTIWG